MMMTYAIPEPEPKPDLSRINLTLPSRLVERIKVVAVQNRMTPGMLVASMLLQCLEDIGEPVDTIVR